MDNFFKQREEIRDSRYVPNYKFFPTQKEFNKHIDEMMKLDMWFLDTETTGLDPHQNKVILIQLGNGHVQYLIDAREVHDLGPLKERMEDEKFLKILHNAKFDYKMMKGSYNIAIEGMHCLMILEQLLTAGLKKRDFAMDDCCLKYLGIEIDKEMQTSFINHVGPFSQKQLRYAALDCIYPYHYSKPMYERMRQLRLNLVYSIECNAIPAFGDIEYYGMLLDETQWKKNMEDEAKKRDVASEAFKKEASKHVQRNLFGEHDVNPASPIQLLELFETMFDRKYLLKNPSDSLDQSIGTGANVLRKLNEKYNRPLIVTSLQAYREHDKKVSTYGQSYMDHIHPLTGRFHPKISQIGTHTGRPAGSKPSMLNIPQDPRYRRPWIAGPNRKILTNDYGACEIRIMSSMSGDPAMCKGFNDGVDYHTYTASQFISDTDEYVREIIRNKKGEPGKNKKGDFVLDNNGNKIKNPNRGTLISYDNVCSDERKIAKAINFGLAYGEGASALAESLKISTEEARNYMAKFNNKFRRLVNWLEQQKMHALKHLRAETTLGRKRFFRPPVKPKWRDEWDELRSEGCNFSNPFDKKLPDEWKSYHAKRASIKREGANSPIQGGNADITKIAMYELRKFIRSVEKKYNNGNYLAHIALQVYDEIVVDCPAEYAEGFAKKMDEIMEKAGQCVIKGIPVETGCIIDDSWVKG